MKTSLEETPLDGQYALVRVTWSLRFEASTIESAATYIVRRPEQQIIVQIDHQDLTQLVAQARRPAPQ